MSEEQNPDVEDIKIRLGDEIPVEEEPLKAEQQPRDVSEELRRLGKQFGETVRTAWNSEERYRFEREMRQGVDSFTKEIDKAFSELRESQPAQRAKDEATEFKGKVESGELGQRTKGSIAQGLAWLSEEMARLANQFTPAEKEPPAEKSPDEVSE